MTRRKLAISCTDRDWARVCALARARGLSASRYAVERALTAHPPPRPPADGAARLVLGAGEQRALLETLARVDAGLREGAATMEMLDRLDRRVRVLVAMAVEEWVRAGHAGRLLAIAEAHLGEERMPAVRAWVQRLERGLRVQAGGASSVLPSG